jgi:hypothetical protein
MVMERNFEVICDSVNIHKCILSSELLLKCATLLNYCYYLYNWKRSKEFRGHVFFSEFLVLSSSPVDIKSFTPGE